MDGHVYRDARGNLCIALVYPGSKRAISETCKIDLLGGAIRADNIDREIVVEGRHVGATIGCDGI